MDYPNAVIEKAKRMEKLLQRVAEGESLDQVCADLEVELTRNNWPRCSQIQKEAKRGKRFWMGALVTRKRPIPRCANGCTSARNKMRHCVRLTWSMR